jgi:SAM-dependent methyltransferase
MRQSACVIPAVLLATVVSVAQSPPSTPGAATAAAPQMPPTIDQPRLAPYVPTPQEVVDRMLQLAEVTASDVVYDLGCGDGRLVVTAAKTYGARGVGIDIDAARIAESRKNAADAGVQHLVEFRQQDALTVDVSPATVVTLYLLTEANMKLRPRLQQQLKPGSRVVSHQFGMGDWVPAKAETITDFRGTSRLLYLWIIGRP